MKKTLAALAILLIAVVAGALLWLRGNLDGLVQDAIETHGGAMSQAQVSVREVAIRPADGVGAIGGLTVGNPAGFKTAHAIKVERIEVEIDIASVARDVVTIRRIAIVAPDIIYEKGDGPTNFDVIQKNIASYLGPGKGDSGGKKLIVEEFTLRGARARASATFLQGEAVAVRLPDIVLRDLGKAKGGITPGELGGEIVKALRTRLAANVNFNALAKSAGSAVEKAGSAIKGLFR
jgi:hypothetical protein